MATVAGLFVYPFKSARGIAVASARLEATGLQWDRHWMAVDESNKFITQRTQPQLARVVPELTEDALVLNAPDMPVLRIPLQPSGDSLTVRIWNDTCTALDQGPAAAAWISRALGLNSRIVRIAAPVDRVANAKYAGPESVPVAFPDGFPILVCNQASLDSLNARMPSSVPMERFRPNLVVNGLPEFAEDGIETLHIGEVTLRLVKPCTRCVIPSHDQRTGEPSTDPMPALRSFRFNRELLGVTFGENAVVSAGIGSTLRRGAAFTAYPRSAGQKLTREMAPPES